MFVKSLEQMEKIVQDNKTLSWDGWSVISLVPTDSGVTSKDGVQIDGKWYLKRVFELTEKGWDIPTKIVG